jgi:DNA-binding response OmpR family regulator
MSTEATPDTLKVLVYSDDRTVRDQIRLALGRRLGGDLPDLEIFDTATPEATVRAVDQNSYDLLILDGEAVPHGGMGVAYQLKDEVPNCPPVLVLVQRVADAWLATWSKADAIQALPVDPIRLPQAAADLVRRHRAGLEVTH